MCGIAGAFGYVDHQVLRAVECASSAQVHRGPDGHGQWSSGVGPGQAVFEHRRLAIIDLSERGHQPMVHRATGNVLCFNGEIYNFKTLREELRGLGHVFHGESDTEVVLLAYAQWGEHCLGRLRGMFAFALWDHRTSRVLLARDRLGIKPLYTAWARTAAGERIMLFASEVRGLLATDMVERKLSVDALHTYVWNGFVQGPQAIIEGVTSLEAGVSLWMDAQGPTAGDRFWQLPTAAPDTSDDAGLARSLAESVELRLVSDVPLGVFLSGGVDSSAVAAMAVAANQGSIQTFNLAFEDAAFDESSWARRVAGALGTDHREVVLTEARFKAELDDALACLDQPTFDGVNTYFVSEAVREAGITVALSGAGGDELFGGYTSFKDLPLARQVSRLVGGPAEHLARMGGKLVQRLRDPCGQHVPPQTRWGKLADVCATRGDMVALYQVSYALFTEDFLDELLCLPRGGTSYGLGAERAAALRSEVARQEPLEAISTLEISSFLGERLLRDTDMASMANSLEVRLPLLDHCVAEEAVRLASGPRFEPLGKKMALRRVALRALDPAIFDRPKSGFVLPIEVWCYQSLQPLITETFADELACRQVGLDSKALGQLWSSYQACAPGIYWSRVWSLFVLLRWCRNVGATL